MRREPLVPLVIMLLLLPVVAFAGTTGKISGRVIDAKSGEPLVGAIVFIKELSLGGSADKDGYYHILNVPPGSHVVTASLLGYPPVVLRNVKVLVDRTTDLDFSLEAQALQAEEIIVEAQRLPVQRDLTSTMQAIDVQEIEALPVNTVEAILQLQTGVVNSGGGLHLRGGRTGEIAYYLDGYRVEDPLFNGQVIEVNNQAIQQMELLSGTFNAEYGNALSGVVNIVTKENTERLNANVTYKRTKLGLSKASDDLNERYYEGYYTGPLWSGSPIGILLSAKKTNADNYYFSGNSRQRFDTTGQLVRESIEFSKNKPFGYDDYFTGMGKVFFRPFPEGKVTFLYNYSNREWQNYDHVLRFIPDSAYVRHSTSSLSGLNLSHTLSDNLFYDIRLSYYRYTYLRNLGGRHYSQYTVPLFLRFDNSRFYRSAADGAYEDQVTKTYTAKGDMTYQIDRFNLVKAGFDFKLHDMDYFYINNPQNPLARLLLAYSFKPWEGAAYVQDKIEFETIILNLGLRADFYDPKADYIVNPLNPGLRDMSTRKTAVSPRVGIAYPVRGNMVFHFAYGQFFQRPEYQIMYENLERVFGTGEPLFGSPRLEPEKTTSYELGLQTFFGTGTTLQATVFSKKIQNLIGVAWNYQPLAYAYYVNEDFATVSGFEISGRWAMRNVLLTGNYTFSVAEGSSSSQQQRYSGAFDIVGTQSLRFLPLDFDQRHTVNAQLHFTFGKSEGPFGFLPEVFENSNLNVLMRYGSGFPFTYNPTRARYVPERNNSRIPATLFLDLLIRKDFPIDKFYLSVFADIRNLFNRRNVRSVYATTGLADVSGSELRNNTPDYDQDPTNYFPPRTIYLGINVGF